jgi:hypothetical protein
MVITRLCWTEIVKKARGLRQSLDQKHAELAKEEYKDCFYEKFSYRIGCKTELYSSPLKIARKYRQLRGIKSIFDCDDEDEEPPR